MNAGTRRMGKIGNRRVTRRKPRMSRVMRRGTPSMRGTMRNNRGGNRRRPSRRRNIRPRRRVVARRRSRRGRRR